MNQILVIEDDPTVATSLSLIISRYGWVVKLAETLAEGISLIKTRFFDVIWLDLNLVDSPWQDTIGRLPEIIEMSRPARIVVSSGHIPEGAQFPHGVRVIYKPSTVEQVLSIIGDPSPL